MASESSVEQSFGQLPALPPPPDTVSNFANPYSRAYLVIMSIAITLPTLTLMVVARVYTKIYANKFGLRFEDYSLLLGYVAFVIYMAIGLCCLKFGLGVDQWNVTIDHAVRFGQLSNCAEIVYWLALFFTKLSIALQLMHIFAPIHQGAAYWICQLYIWAALLYHLALVLVTIFPCHPRAKLWEPWLPGKCVDVEAVFVASSVINTVSDVILFFVPLVSIWRLQTSANRKWGISAVFATGAFACICSTMRIVESVRILGSQNLTMGILDLGLWAHGEIGSGMISCCMPIMPQFFRHVIPKVTSKIGSSTGIRTDVPYSATSSRLGRGPVLSTPSRPDPEDDLSGPFVEMNEEYQAKAHDVSKQTSNA